ncbi:Myb-like protein V [Anabarilius grahami]|uniref:Myb-like protein V n=1 Tax=Anabarilius grahami TaxID=495550 RepID=A0A3N0Y6T3_ANAGA|nr:Myb-like protein V [Anabarilius grahami]
MGDHGFPLTRSLIKVLAMGIIKESDRSKSTTVNMEKGPSDVWWARFKARHPELTSRTADSLDRARVHCATLEAFEGFFKLNEALYVKHSLEDKPHLIYNCDETGFGDKPRLREKVLCQTGRKHVYQQQQMTREHITDKGYMDSELFLKWLRHFVKYAPEERPLILIMDQHETHVSKDVIMYCRENKIEILCLPAQTTHILQPLDIAVFNPLKTAFSTMASRMGLVRGDLVVGKKQFSPLLKNVYPTAVIAQNIKAGFRKAGIFPLSRGAVDTTQVVRVLPSADGSDTTQSITPTTPSATPSSAPVTPSATPSSAPVTPSATPSSAPVTPSATPSITPTTPSATQSITPLTPSATPSSPPLTPSATPSSAPLTPSATPSSPPAVRICQSSPLAIWGNEPSAMIGRTLSFAGFEYYACTEESPAASENWKMLPSEDTFQAAEEEAFIYFIFWMADHGFPLTRSLIKVLAMGIIKESGRSQSTTVNMEKGPSDVWVAPKNYLVAAGIIPESLANVLMSPALERKEKVRRRIPLPARVITSDQYFNLLVEKEAEEKEMEEKKRKRKEEIAKKNEEKRQAQEAKRQKQQAAPPTDDDGEHCALCRRVVPPGSGDEAIDE